MEIEVVDVYLNVAWAWQWEMKSQFNGDQKKTILCQKNTYFGMFYNISYASQFVISGATCFEK